MLTLFGGDTTPTTLSKIDILVVAFADVVAANVLGARVSESDWLLLVESDLGTYCCTDGQDITMLGGTRCNAPTP
jgi:hypothetical protein